MLYSSDFDIIVDPARSLIINLTIILIVACYIGGFYSYIITRSPEEGLSRKYFVGLSLVAILFGTGRLIYLIHDYYLPNYIGSLNVDVLLWKIGSTISSLGGLLLVYIIETYVYKKTKHIITLTGIVLTGLVIIVDYPMPAKLIATITNIMLVSIVFIIYIGIYKNSTGVVRRNALIILIGLTILTIGQSTALFSDVLGVMTVEQSSIFAPPVTLAGLIILGTGLIWGRNRKTGTR